jgi:conjugal transfer ATP-binding protein TraC
MSLSKIGAKINEFFSGVLEPPQKDLTLLGELYHISDFLPYRWFDPDSEAFISEDSVGIIFETAPLVGNSESMQRELSNIFTQILPEESSVQVMLYADKNIGDILNAYEEKRRDSSETMKKLAARRAQFLRKLAIGSHLSPYVLRDFRCYTQFTMIMRDIWHHPGS